MKNKLLFLLLLLIIPGCVYASDFYLACDKGPFKSNQTFNCQIKVSESYVYEEVSATINGTNNLICSAPVIGQGLEEVELTDNSFKAKGQEVTGVIASFSCAVKELKNDVTDQIEIDNFSYKTKEKENVEVLRSSKLELKKMEIEEIKDDKPRDVTYKESLLSSLSSPQLNFTFSSYLTKYEQEVTNDVTHIDLSYETMVEGATTELQGSLDLSEGINIIDVYVTSPDGIHRTCYTIYVTRLKEGEDIYYPEQDSTLKSLKIKGKSIGFEINKYEYNLHLYSNESSIVVEAEANNKDAKVDIDKMDNLKNGDKITVTVTSVDGINKTKYVINVHKDAPKRNYTPVIVIGGIVLAIILIFVGVVKTNNKKISETTVTVQQPIQPEQPQVNPMQPVQPVTPQPQAQVVDPNAQQPQNPVDTSNNTNI